ncbi:hypothetical protein BDA96_01G097300 [Sorghum bicolor]|uniref:Secreted protein n=1 Tax=Sorghum bicolor TaxID=4558 RepID=A0A921RY33_SORBI|nr:hypothetical protein BDA96_01G097300 [Sorghum bicolor]
MPLLLLTALPRTLLQCYLNLSGLWLRARRRQCSPSVKAAGAACLAAIEQQLASSSARSSGGTAAADVGGRLRHFRASRVGPDDPAELLPTSGSAL